MKQIYYITQYRTKDNTLTNKELLWCCMSMIYEIYETSMMLYQQNFAQQGQADFLTFLLLCINIVSYHIASKLQLSSTSCQYWQCWPVPLNLSVFASIFLTAVASSWIFGVYLSCGAFMPQLSGLKLTLYFTIGYFHFSLCILEAKILQSSKMNCTLAEKDHGQGTPQHASFFPSYKATFGNPSCHVTSKKSQTCSVSATIKKKLTAISAHPGHRPRPHQSIMWNSVGDFCNCCCMGVI